MNVQKRRGWLTKATPIADHHHRVADSHFRRQAGTKFAQSVEDMLDERDQIFRILYDDPGCDGMPTVRLELDHVARLRRDPTTIILESCMSAKGPTPTEGCGSVFSNVECGAGGEQK